MVINIIMILMQLQISALYHRYSLLSRFGYVKYPIDLVLNCRETDSSGNVVRMQFLTLMNLFL